MAGSGHEFRFSSHKEFTMVMVLLVLLIKCHDLFNTYLLRVCKALKDTEDESLPLLRMGDSQRDRH